MIKSDDLLKEYKQPEDVLISSNELQEYISNLIFVATDDHGNQTMTAERALEWVSRKIEEMREDVGDERR